MLVMFFAASVLATLTGPVNAAPVKAASSEACPASAPVNVVAFMLLELSLSTIVEAVAAVA
jgi:hypothetical protein